MGETVTWVGLDAHKKFINVAVLSPDRREIEQWEIKNESRSVRRLARKLVRDSPAEVRCCYEAGVCGYALKRQLEEAAPLVCEVVAPALIPVKPGERIKTDRRDARKLAMYLKGGLLTEVHAPTPAEEAVRNLCRCREDVKEDLLRARHRLSKFLVRSGLSYTGGKKAWTKVHREWLRGLRFDNLADQVVFNEYLLSVEVLEERLASIGERLDTISQQAPYKRPVGWLRTFRGIDTVTAMTIVAELHDFRRFTSPRQLMSYLGLVPSEDSSGSSHRRGSITKAGNAHVRRVLVEAAWHYRHRPGVGVALRKRRKGQPTAVVTIADKAQIRLHRRYRRLVEKGRPNNKAAVAVARELVGFIWAVLRTNPQQVPGA